MESIKQYSAGDMAQVKALGHQYRHLLALKEKYIADTLAAELRPAELRDLDVGFRLLTMRIKMVESKMHYLMFGGDLNLPETDPKPLKYYLDFYNSDESVYWEYASKLNELRVRVTEQKDTLNAQTAALFKLQHELNLKNEIIRQRDKEIAELNKTKPAVIIKRVVKKETPRPLTEAQKSYRQQL